MIRIDPNGDVEIEVVEMIRIKDSEDRVHLRPIRKERFLCRKAKLLQATDYFQAMFKNRQDYVGGSFVESQQNIVQLNDTHIDAMDIWLRAIHGVR